MQVQPALDQVGMTHGLVQRHRRWPSSRGIARTILEPQANGHSRETESGRGYFRIAIQRQRMIANRCELRPCEVASVTK